MFHSVFTHDSTFYLFPPSLSLPLPPWFIHPPPSLSLTQTLSPNGVSEAAVSVECLADDKDLVVILTKGTYCTHSACTVHVLCVHYYLMYPVGGVEFSITLETNCMVLI